MKYIGKAIAAVGFCAIGMWGYTVDIEHSGWLIFVAILCIL
jgi:preprotein translocase subunit Sss1